MEQSNFIINNFVQKIKDSLSKEENLLNKFTSLLVSEGVNFKDNPEEGLVTLFSDFNKTNKSALERECRSMVLDRETLEIVSYTCEEPLCNADAKHFILNHEYKQDQQSIFQCYEGSLMSVFNFKGKWYLSTRKCLNSANSVWKGDKSHYHMFDEALKANNITDFNTLTSSLDPKYCYYFILLHHQNINVVDYTSEFGENYKKIILAFIREQSSQTEIDLYNQELLRSVIHNDTEKSFMIVKKYDDMSKLEEENNKGIIEVPAKNEGLLIKVIDNNKTFILKFHTSDYLFGIAVGPDKNLYKGFLKLYQTNHLSDYLQNNKNFDKYKKIINPNNPADQYDTVGTVDACFKVITSEAYEQLKLFWDIKSGSQKNKELYQYLPKEHRDLMFAIRGIYFQKKAEYITNKKNNTTTDNKYIQRSVLKISDIYELFKSYDINKLEAYLKARKLLLNLVNKEKDNETIQLLKPISNRCDKVLLKLIAIYTNHLFPNLTNDDLPEMPETETSKEVAVAVNH